MTHAKGPWVVGPVDDTVVTHVGMDGIRYEIATIDGDYNDPETWPIMEANARLISAAPDLLEALKVAQLWLDVDGRYDMQGINAAISKAEGNQP